MVTICLVVSYRQELRKSFLVPDFTTEMSLAEYGISTKREFQENLYIAHLPHFHESINNNFSNIRKMRVLVIFNYGILLN